MSDLVPIFIARSVFCAYACCLNFIVIVCCYNVLLVIVVTGFSSFLACGSQFKLSW